MNKNSFLTFTIDMAKEAGHVLMQHYGKISTINKKSSDIDLVTIADTQSEQLIITKIQKYYPNHYIISEESDHKKIDSDYCWIIDPLDGTTNYVHSLPIFSVSIALQYKNETIIGVVYNPAVDKCFYAEKNNGAFLNNNKINVTSCDTLSESLLVTGFPYIHDERYKKGFALFEELYGQTQGVRRLGAASLDLCFVAMGRFEAFWEFSLQSWDICAGDLIVREANGKTSDWDNSHLPLDGSRILATNGHIHKEMIGILSKNMF